MPPFTPFIEMQAKQPLPLPEQKEIFYVLFSVCFLGPQVSVAETCTTWGGTGHHGNDGTTRLSSFPGHPAPCLRHASDG